jgi:uncharacterized protein YdcH (DUF465 family)
LPREILEIPVALVLPSQATLLNERQEAPMSQDPVLRDDLLFRNEEYRRLDAQHHEYESRLNRLSDKVVLSDDEQVEEVMLKKKKLHLKDRMQEIARQFREGALQA